VAPHNLNIRPLIVPDTSVIEVSFDAKERSNVVWCTDNRDCSLNTGESLTISKAAFAITSVSLGTAGFIDALNEKLLWGEDKRNDK
jgi:NAD+ kinase